MNDTVSTINWTMANIYVTVYFTLFLHALFTLFWTKRTWNIVNLGTKFFPPPHCPLFPRLRWKCLEQTYLANSLVSCMLFSNVHSQNYPWTKARENSRKRCEFVFSIRTPLRSVLHPSLPPPGLCVWTHRWPVTNHSLVETA